MQRRSRGANAASCLSRRRRSPHAEYRFPKEPLLGRLRHIDFDEADTLLTAAHGDGTVQLRTFMSDDPTFNTVRHREIGGRQDRLG